jgi:type IV pilus assembly protein PilA
MFCSRCGAELTSTSAFCSKCGTPTGAGIDPATALKRPALITFLAVLQFIGAVIWLPLGVITIVMSVPSNEPDAGLGLGIGALWLVLGTVNLSCGIGLWKLKPYGRTLQIVLAAIGLFAVPIGTVIGALILYYMYRPGIRALFSGKPAAEFTPVELAEIAVVTQRSSVAVVIIVVCVFLGSVAALGIIAAIAVPALLRARMAGNEAVAIGSLRSVLSAEAAYSASGGGGYATSLATLVKPCPNMSQGFITPDLGQDPSRKSGYFINLESAEAAAGPHDCHGAPTEMDFYATAVPQQFNTTGRRAFSTSAAGTIFVDDSGRAPSRSSTLDGTATPVR